METFASMKGQVNNWSSEPIDDNLLGDAVNDAIENLGNAICLSSMQRLVQGPIQNLNFAAGDERQTIVSIADPTVAPTVSNFTNNNSTAPYPRTVLVAYTYITESGSETNLSPSSSFPITAASILASCAPPAVITNSYGWNCYMGTVAGQLRRQNNTPIPFTLPCIEIPSGCDTADQIFAPLSNTTADNITYIDNMEVQNQDGTWTRWTNADIYGLAFQRASSLIASSSTYTKYVWDIINERQVEVRPKVGGNFNPRYFYVAKPRRLLFPESTLPFQSHAGATGFIRYFALSLVSLVNHEYDASARWENKANAERQAIVLVTNNQNVARQKTITPFLYG